MSTQSHVVRARAPNLAVAVVESVRTRLSSFIERVIANREARAEHEVRAILTSFSAERLAEYGWGPEDIKRLNG
jgi:hypothetical protein